MVYDLVMLGILLLTLWRGATKGIAWQVAGLASLALSFVFATPLSAKVAPYIPLDAPLNRWVSMLVIYTAFSFGCFAVARGFRGWLERSKLEEFDRHLGAMFGLMKGAVGCFVVTFFAVCLSDASGKMVIDTVTGRVCISVMNRLQGVLPRELEEVIASRFERAERNYGGDSDYDSDDVADRGRDDSDPDRFPSSFRGSRKPQDEDDSFSGNRGPKIRPDADAERRRNSGGDDPLDSATSTVSKMFEKLPQALGDRIKDAFKDAITNTLGGGKEPEPEPAETGRLDLAADRQAIEDLLTEVRDAVTSTGAERRGFDQNVSNTLRGLPPQTTLPLLKDWVADLNGGRDPDPGTDDQTALVDRIVHHLKKSGVRPSQLPAALRDAIFPPE